MLSHDVTALWLRLMSIVRARMYRLRINRVSTQVLHAIDREEFDRQFRDDPKLISRAGRGSSKFINLERWIRENTERYFRYGFFKTRPGGRVLDIGCGSGFFLLVCRHFGLEAVGLDME